MHMKKLELTGSFSRFLALYKFLCLYVCKTYKKTTKAYLNRYRLRIIRAASKIEVADWQLKVMVPGTALIWISQSKLIMTIVLLFSFPRFTIFYFFWFRAVD